MSSNMMGACLLFLVGQTMAWFQINSQFVWEWWAANPILTVFLYSIPTSLCFLFGVRMAYSEMDSLWGPRFIIFGMSYLTFPILTWLLVGESPFTIKTIVSAILSFIIVGIQLFWRT